MDLSETIAPTSDQLDAVDLLGGPRVFTIERVSKGNAEQPVNIHLVEFPRPWRPGKSMRRVLVAAWGKDGSTYAGRQVRLYCDPNVTFGSDKVGGTRISHLSHIDKPVAVPLLVSRGRSKVYKVDPLPKTPQGAAPSSTNPTGAATPGAVEVEGNAVAPADAPPPADTQPITPDHEHVIGEHMRRAGLTGADVLATARAITGRELTSARDLTAAEADTLITTLADLPGAPPEA